MIGSHRVLSHELPRPCVEVPPPLHVPVEYSIPSMLASTDYSLPLAEASATAPGRPASDGTAVDRAVAAAALARARNDAVKAATADAAAAAAGAGAPARRWASAEDWERHKSIISELYQHRKLRDVVEHMERVYDFYATERMYKFRIKTWGLKKNYRADAVQKAIQRLEQGRIDEADGAATGKGVPKLDLPRLQRYLRRNPAALQKLRRSQQGAGSGIADITIPELQTLLSRAVRAAVAGGPSQPNATATAAAAASSSRPILPAKVRASPDVEAPDEILRLLRAYIAGSYPENMDPVEAAALVAAQPDRDEAMLDFVLKFRSAHLMIAEQQLRAGFYCLRVCFERIEHVLQGGGFAARRVLLLYLLNAALEVSVDFAMPEVVQIMFRHVRTLTETSLGPHHPATEIMRRFAQLQACDHVSVLRLTRRLIREDLEGGAGGAHRLRIPAAVSEPAFALYNLSLDLCGASVEDISAGLQRVRLGSSDAVRNCWLILLYIQMRVSIAMYEQGRPDEVETLLGRDFPTMPRRKQPDRVNLMLRCFKLRGDKRTEEGRLLEGEQHYKGYISLAETTWGPTDECVVDTMADLRVNLLKQGKVDEAAKVKEDWQRRINERQRELERERST